MSNHFSDPDLVPEAIKERINTAPEGLGATGNFPLGKLSEHDEGELAYAVAADETTDRVLINFGKPIAFLGMTGEQAIEFGRMLIEKGEQLTK